MPRFLERNLNWDEYDTRPWMALAIMRGSSEPSAAASRAAAAAGLHARAHRAARGRGLHSSTFQLVVSTLCGIREMYWVVSVPKTAGVELRCGRV